MPLTLDEVAREGGMGRSGAERAVASLLWRGIVLEVRPWRGGSSVRYATVDERLNELLAREHGSFEGPEEGVVPATWSPEGRDGGSGGLNGSSSG